jgi:hypothetical protein
MNSKPALQTLIPLNRLLQTVSLWFGFVSISLSFYVVQSNNQANFQNFKLQYVIAAFFLICTSFLSFLLLLASGFVKKSYLIMVVSCVLFFIVNFVSVKAMVELVQNGNVLFALYGLVFSISGLLVFQLLSRYKTQSAFFVFTFAWGILTLLFYEQFFLNPGNAWRYNILQFISNPQAQAMFSNVLLLLSFIGFASVCNLFIQNYNTVEKK